MKPRNQGNLWRHHIQQEFNEDFTYTPKFHWFYWSEKQELSFLLKPPTNLRS